MQNEQRLNGFGSLKAIFFDMDGVIYDSMGNHSVAWSKAFAALGLDFPLEQVYMNEGRTGSSTVQMFFQEKLGRKATEEEISFIYDRKSQFFEAMPAPVPIIGIKLLLERLSREGIAIWVVTGSAQELLLEGLCSDFPGLVHKEKIVSAKDVRFGKPDPEPYLMALRKSGFRPEEVLVIENAPLGVESAKAAGIFTLCINTGILADEILWQSGADEVVKEVEEVERLIFKE
ncbi:MAG: HAD-IA family hydrolase [Prolixibacteraceae bacterium]|jgi:HAD superfamily hydrolase (TIGR01509 family)|nr:HAD-IA family hydrolase [Prolixibacteraceae bacterium]